MKKIIALLLVIASVLAFTACGVDEGDSDSVKIKIDVKDYGTMTLELYPKIAPKTVKNFLAYVDKGFYDGLTFHRVMKGFMIQGGDPKGNGTGDGDLPPIKGEFKQNGFDNTLSHTYGVISMARQSGNMNSATSQFFICNADASASLDGGYAAFGKLIDGSDVLDAISNVKVGINMFGENSSPVTPVVIEKIYRAD